MLENAQRPCVFSVLGWRNGNGRCAKIKLYNVQKRVAESLMMRYNNEGGGRQRTDLVKGVEKWLLT